MNISFSKADITPLLPINPSGRTNPYLGGYGVDAPRVAIYQNPYKTPLYARCFVLWDDGKPNVLLVADVLGFPRSMHQTIRRRVIGLAPQLQSSRFILQATHTHNGPVLKDKLHPFISYNLTDLALVNAYSNWLENQIVSLVSDTLRARQVSCSLDYQVADEDFAYNREGLPYKERAVPILVARDAGGAPIAVLFSYGCHPVSAGGQNLFDGDFPSAACERVENRLGVFAIFVQGPAGDQDPPRLYRERPNDPWKPRDFRLRDIEGYDLGETVANAVQQRGRFVSGPLEADYIECELPLDITDTPSNLESVKWCYERRKALYPGQAASRHADIMIQQIEARAFEASVSVPIQVWKMKGSPMLRIVLTGGELVSGYGEYFRARYGGAEQLLIGGYANEVSAYIPSDELLPPQKSGGSYDGGWWEDFPGIAGGSQIYYGYLGHFLRETPTTRGAESTLEAAISSLL
jgi:neutral ceramidase